MPRKVAAELVKITHHVDRADLDTIRRHHPGNVAPALRELLGVYADRLREQERMGEG